MDTPEIQPNKTDPIPSSPSTTVSNGVPQVVGSTVPATPAVPAAPAESHKNKKWLSVVLIIIALVVAGALAAYLLKPSKQQVVSTKKDIAFLRVGIENAGEVPQYPVNYPNNIDDFFIETQMFESLVGFNNQTQIVPLLATNWTNPTDTTWVFNIRQGVKFHSGRTLTAQDVKFTLDYAAAHVGSNGGNMTYATTAENIKKVDVNGPYQVTITTDQPDPIFLSQLAQMGIVDSKATLGDYNAGTGPYVPKPGTTPTSSSIDLVAADNYWGGHIYTRELTITLYDDIGKMADDTVAGKLDVSGPYGSDNLAKLPNHQVFKISDQGPTIIGINTKRSTSPLYNVAARQAVAYALDIPSVLKAAGRQGIAQNQIVPPELPGYNPSIATIEYNPTKARQLLTGVPNASGEITFGYATKNTAQDQEMINELKAAGFNVKGIAEPDFGTYIVNALGGKYDLYSFAELTQTEDGLDLLNTLLVGNSNYDNPEVNKLVDQAGSTLNTSQRITDMQQVASIVDKDKPLVSLYTLHRAYVAKPNLVVNTDLPAVATSSYFWETYQK